ncbi:MAG: flippase [Candidatus Marinimicrobia bacterium]|jgi:O-antigen/teichoic acid export membrane protein|nr:flippase [Candidatus Neomarinimicrobiota bacterium]
MNSKIPKQSGKIAKEATISFVGMGIGDAARYLFTAILARFAGIEFLGIYSLASSITRIGEVFGRAGLHSGVMRFVSRLDKETEIDEIKQRILSGLKLGLMFGIVIMIFQIAFADWLAFELFNGSELLKTVLIISAVSLPFATIMAISAFATQGFKLLKYKVMILNIIRPVIMMVCVLISISFFTKAAAIKYPLLISAVFSSFAAVIFLGKLTKIKMSQIFSGVMDKELLRFSYPLMFVTILGTFMHWMDIMMLGYFTDTTTVGLYHPAARTAGLLRTVLLAFMGIFSPMMSEYHRKGDIGEMGKLYKLIVRWIISLSLPLAIILILYSKKIMLLFGVNYLSASNVLIVLTGAAFLQIIFGSGGHTLTMSGFTKVNLVNSIIVVLINITLNILWIPHFGIIGAAYATFVSMALLGILRIVEVYYFIKLNPFSLKLLKPIIAGVIMALVLISIKPMVLSLHTIVSLIIILLVGLLSFFFMLWMLKFDDDDREIWSGIGMITNRRES